MFTQTTNLSMGDVCPAINPSSTVFNFLRTGLLACLFLLGIGISTANASTQGQNATTYIQLSTPACACSILTVDNFMASNPAYEGFSITADLQGGFEVIMVSVSNIPDNTPAHTIFGSISLDDAGVVTTWLAVWDGGTMTVQLEEM